MRTKKPLTIILCYKFILIIFLFYTPNTLGENDYSQSIGFYSAGCIKNPDILPSDGPGFQVIRLSRKRYYGHPDLTGFIKYLGKVVSENYQSTLLIGDTSQLNGGPMLPEHSSHQIGLDVDIFYTLNPIESNKTPSINKREEINPMPIIFPGELTVDSTKWKTKTGEVIKISALHGNVDRIFVNPVIKRKLCGTYKSEGWLRKIRPWWGHDSHFHVRLKCPASSPLCKSQKSLPQGSGCGEDLTNWLIDILKNDRKVGTQKKKVDLPKECLDIVLINQN